MQYRSERSNRRHCFLSHTHSLSASRSLALPRARAVSFSFACVLYLWGSAPLISLRSLSLGICSPDQRNRMSSMTHTPTSKIYVFAWIPNPKGFCFIQRWQSMGIFPAMGGDKLRSTSGATPAASHTHPHACVLFAVPAPTHSPSTPSTHKHTHTTLHTHT